MIYLTANTPLKMKIIIYLLTLAIFEPCGDCAQERARKPLVLSTPSKCQAHLAHYNSSHNIQHGSPLKNGIFQQSDIHTLRSGIKVTLQGLRARVH